MKVSQVQHMLLLSTFSYKLAVMTHISKNQPKTPLFQVFHKILLAVTYFLWRGKHFKIKQCILKLFMMNTQNKTPSLSSTSSSNHNLLLALRFLHPALRLLKPRVLPDTATEFSTKICNMYRMAVPLTTALHSSLQCFVPFFVAWFSYLHNN